MSMWTDLSRTAHTVRFVDVGKWRTRVLEAGSGPALLLMHGSGGHLEAYTRNVSALARSRRVVAFDFPGHGFTSPADADLEMPDYVEHVLGLLDALDIQDADVSGESLGGWVAMALASGHPDRIRRMVLNTPGGTMCNPAVMERIRVLSQDAADDPSDDRIRARLTWLMAEPSAVTDELVRVRQEIYAQPGFAGSMRHILCLQAEDVRRRNMISDDALRSMKAPTRVVWTSDDPSGPVAEGRRITDLLPHGDFRLIEQAGHWPQWEQPDEFNVLVLSFLDDGPT